MQTIADADDIIGVYDLHAYPGQAEVRSSKPQTYQPTFHYLSYQK